jgi:hypothetical protein
MADAGRVVIRSSWLATVLNFSPVAVAFLGIQIWQRSLDGAAVWLVVIIVATVVMHHVNYTELTAAGVGIHWFRTILVPWPYIGSVELVSSWGGHELKVHDAHTGHRLPAPRGAFGVGRRDAAKARDLIEHWWMANRGLPVPTPIRHNPPLDASGRPIDPWVPPPED